MGEAIVLPGDGDGGLAPAGAFLHWLEHLHTSGAHVLDLAALPEDNGSLPDLLRLAGIERLRLPAGAGAPCRWEGLAGAQVTVDAGAGPGDGADLPPRLGPLPGQAVASAMAMRDEDLARARLADAAAVVGLGAGADWSTSGDGDGLPAGLRAGGLADRFAVWNPLPFARGCLVSLPGRGALPASLVDGAGARHPVQALPEGGGVTGLPLGALERRLLRADPRPAPGAHWEVDARVIDNGRLRAELDGAGRLARLCIDGDFVALDGPLVAPALAGVPLIEAAEVRVEHAGPVFAALSVTHRTPAGCLHVAYRLHAHESVLRIAARWDGDPRLAPTLDHPTVHRHAVAWMAGDWAGRPLWPSGAPAAGPCRWLALGDHGSGLGLAAAGSLRVQLDGGRVRVALSGATHAVYALTGTRPQPDLGLGTLAQHLSCAGLALDAGCAGPAPWRLVGADGVMPLWTRRPAGWLGEIALSEQTARPARLGLYLGTPPREAWKVDAGGTPLQRIAATAEGDGQQILLRPNELALVRWR